MNLVTMPGNASASASCTSCGAPLAEDQHYCLACGKPSSPTRLAFLDALQAPHAPQAPTGLQGPPGPGVSPAWQSPSAVYALPAEPEGAVGWLHRYSGVLALFTAVLVTALIGLLVGHWLAPGGGPSKQVLELKGLPTTLGVPAGSTTGAAGQQSSSTGTQAAPKEKISKAEEVKEVKEAEASKPPPPVKTSSTSLKKLSKLKGRSYQRALNKLVKGDQPIQTGG